MLPNTFQTGSTLPSDWMLSRNSLTDIASCVGTDTALSFEEWCRIYNDLPSVEDILKGRCRRYPKRHDALFALAEIPEERREDVTRKLADLRGGNVRVWEDRIDDRAVTLITCRQASLLPLLLASAYACAIRGFGCRSSGGGRMKVF